QALAGPTGVKTATAVRSGVGAAHILALKPGPGGGTAVQCGGIDYLETLCIRATPASGPGCSSSVLSQVTGAIVTFRRGSGTGTATIQYNRTVVENLPAAFTAPTVGSFMIPVSWSSGD